MLLLVWVVPLPKDLMNYAETASYEIATSRKENQSGTLCFLPNGFAISVGMSTTPYAEIGMQCGGLSDVITKLCRYQRALDEKITDGA